MTRKVRGKQKPLNKEAENYFEHYNADKAFLFRWFLFLPKTIPFRLSGKILVQVHVFAGIPELYESFKDPSVMHQ